MIVAVRTRGGIAAPDLFFPPGGHYRRTLPRTGDPMRGRPGVHWNGPRFMQRVALALLLVSTAAVAQTQEPAGRPVPRGALEGCQALDTAEDQLACYRTVMQGGASPARPDGGTDASAADMPDPLPRGALSGCRDLDVPEDRLQCYDTVLGRTPSEVSTTPPQETESGAGQSAASTGGKASPPSPIAQRWQLVAQSDRGPFVLTPYRPTYALPLSYNASPDGASDSKVDKTEVKFQLSFKTKIWPNLLTSRGDLWFGYTQTSYWQAYSTSSPFRETNYEPELIYAYKTNYGLLGMRGRVLTLSIDHQSNGRGDPDSRSWNRVIGGALLDRGNLALSVKGWWRIPESPSQDDNPDITHYMGHGQIRGFYHFDEQTLSLMVRSNFAPGDLKGAVQADYSVPLGGAVKGYLQLFHGYGDGLIDYNHVSNRVSLGIMLTDWY